MHQSLCSLSILSRVPTIVNVRESFPQGLVGFRGFTHGKKAIQELVRGLDPSGVQAPNEDSRVSSVCGADRVSSRQPSLQRNNSSAIRRSFQKVWVTIGVVRI
jgi:hypothetical protein